MIAHALPSSFIVAASTAFPVEGQRGRGKRSSRAAIPEISVARGGAGRSTGCSALRDGCVEGLSIFEIASAPFRRVGDRWPPDSAERPSFDRVFWPTLGAAVLSNAAFVFGIIYSSICSYDEPGFSVALGTTAGAVGPAAAAMMGGRFETGLLGSAAGLGIVLDVKGTGLPAVPAAAARAVRQVTQAVGAARASWA